MILLPTGCHYQLHHNKKNNDMKVKLKSNNCINSHWIANWLAKKDQECCECIVSCKVLVEYKGSSFVVTEDEFKNLNKKIR